RFAAARWPEYRSPQVGDQPLLCGGGEGGVKVGELHHLLGLYPGSPPGCAGYFVGPGRSATRIAQSAVADAAPARGQQPDRRSDAKRATVVAVASSWRQAPVKRQDGSRGEGRRARAVRRRRRRGGAPDDRRPPRGRRVAAAPVLDGGERG